MKCTRSKCTWRYRHFTYGIVATILLSFMSIGIGMNQAAYGQYYDYSTGTYHATNTSIHNVTSINITASLTHTENSNRILREPDTRNTDGAGPRSVIDLIKQNQATESYRAELEGYIESHNVDMSDVKGMSLSLDQLEAIVKEHIATGSAAGATADIIDEYLAPALETFGIIEKENDAK